MFNEMIKLSHPAIDFYNDNKNMYVGVLIPNTKDKIVNFILKNKPVKTATSCILTDCFELKNKNDMLNENVFIAGDLDDEYINCSVDLLNKIVNKDIPDVSFNDVYFEILNILKEYIYFDKEAEYHILTCYIIGSYFYRLFSYFPILHFYAERGSGKTISAKLIQLMGWNSYYTLNITKASLSRVNSQRRGVVIIDEKENINDNEDLKLILNGCFQKGSREVLTEKNELGNHKVTYFELYAPVVICSINPIYGATSDRIIRIEMNRHKVNNNIFEHLDDAEWQVIRDKLLVCLLKNWKVVKQKYQDFSCDYLENRDLDIWKPILSIYSLFNADDCIEKYLKSSYFEYKKDIQEFSYASMICDFIIENYIDSQEVRARVIYDEFRNSVFNDKHLYNHLSLSMFGSIMKRIGYVEPLKHRDGKGNLYFLSHKIAKDYNTRYFYKVYDNEYSINEVDDNMMSFKDKFQESLLFEYLKKNGVCNLEDVIIDCSVPQTTLNHFAKLGKIYFPEDGKVTLND